MEDYIVIILTIIILIFGAVGRNKKKIALQPQNKEPFASDDFWGVIEELGIQPTTPQPVEKLNEKIEIIKEPEKNRFYGFTAEEEGGSILKNSIFKSELNRKKTKRDTIKNKRFSLREAVIYSEILNRKYI